MSYFSDLESATQIKLKHLEFFFFFFPSVIPIYYAIIRRNLGWGGLLLQLQLLSFQRCCKAKQTNKKKVFGKKKTQTNKVLKLVSVLEQVLMPLAPWKLILIATKGQRFNQRCSGLRSAGWNSAPDDGADIFMSVYTMYVCVHHGQKKASQWHACNAERNSNDQMQVSALSQSEVLSWLHWLYGLDLTATRGSSTHRSYEETRI